MRANRCSPPGEKNVSHFIFYLFDLNGTLTDNPDPTTILPPLTTKRPLYTKYYPRVQCNLISNTSAFFSSLLLLPFLLLPRALSQLFPLLSHPFLLVFCCVLVKSQLATVSRSLAALTMASGIMLNTAPRLLSPSTGVSDALWSTQERDGGLSMKMSLQLHKHVSQTPSLSALPPLASPFPTFLKHFFSTVFWSAASSLAALS